MKPQPTIVRTPIRAPRIADHHAADDAADRLDAPDEARPRRRPRPAVRGRTRRTARRRCPVRPGSPPRSAIVLRRRGEAAIVRSPSIHSATALRPPAPRGSWALRLRSSRPGTRMPATSTATATNDSASTTTTPVEAAQRDREAAERRAHQPGDVLADRAERVRRGKLAGHDQARHEGQRRRAADPREHGLAGGDEVDDPQAVGRGDREERQQERRLEQRAGDEDPTAVDPVHQDARHLADEQGRDRLDHEHGRGREGRAR